MLQISLSDWPQFVGHREEGQALLAEWSSASADAQLVLIASLWLEDHFAGQHIAYSDSFADTADGVRLTRTVIVASADYADFAQTYAAQELQSRPHVACIFVATPDRS